MITCRYCGANAITPGAPCAGCGAAPWFATGGVEPAPPAAPRSTTRRQWVIGVITVSLVLLVAGGTAAWAVNRGPQPVGPVAVGPSPTTLVTPTPVPTVTTPPAPQPTPYDVAVAPAVSSAWSDTVAELLGRHFQAINTGDYTSYVSTLGPSRTAPDPARFQSEFGSTRDSAVGIDGLEDTDSDSTVVTYQFVSTQDLANAPKNLQAEQICWRQTVLVTGLGTDPRLGALRSSSESVGPC